MTTMPVSVFASPTPSQTGQATMEPAPPTDETTQPENGYVGYSLDDDGNKVQFPPRTTGRRFGIQARTQAARRKAKGIRGSQTSMAGKQEGLEKTILLPANPSSRNPPWIQMSTTPTICLPQEERDKACQDMKKRAEHHSFPHRLYEGRRRYTPKSSSSCTASSKKKPEDRHPAKAKDP